MQLFKVIILISVTMATLAAYLRGIPIHLFAKTIVLHILGQCRIVWAKSSVLHRTGTWSRSPMIRHEANLVEMIFKQEIPVNVLDAPARIDSLHAAKLIVNNHCWPTICCRPVCVLGWKRKTYIRKKIELIDEPMKRPKTCLTALKREVPRKLINIRTMQILW